MAKFTISLEQRSGLTPHPQARKVAKKLAGKMVAATRDSKQRTTDYLPIIDGQIVSLSSRGINEFVGPTKLNGQERAMAKIILATILAAEELPTALLTLIDKPATANEPNITKRDLRIKVINVEEQSPIEEKPIEKRPTTRKETISEFKTTPRQKIAMAIAGSLATGTIASIIIGLPIVAPILLAGFTFVIGSGSYFSIRLSHQNFHGTGIISINRNCFSENEKTNLRSALINKGFGRGLHLSFEAETGENDAKRVIALIRKTSRTQLPLHYFPSEDGKHIEFCPCTETYQYAFVKSDPIYKKSGDPLLILKKVNL